MSCEEGKAAACVQRAHWTDRALINELIDQVAMSQAPQSPPLLALHIPQPPQPALPSQPHPQPAVPSHHISSSTTQRFSGVGLYGYANDGQLHISQPPTLRCWRRGSADNKAAIAIARADSHGLSRAVNTHVRGWLKYTCALSQKAIIYILL